MTEKMTTKELILAFLAKAGTVVSDRRFWVSVFGFIAVQTGLISFEDEQIQELANILSVLVPQAFLLISWALRPPSGANYSSEEQFARAIKEIYKP